MESAKDHSVPSGSHVVLVNLEGIDEAVPDELHKHLVVLLLDGGVERCATSLVFQIEIDELTGLIKLDHVRDGLVLLFADGNMNGSGLKGVYVIEVNAKISAFE